LKLKGSIENFKNLKGIIWNLTNYKDYHDIFVKFKRSKEVFGLSFNKKYITKGLIKL